MVDLLADGQITHMLSLLSGGRKRPFAVEMLAVIQSSHTQLMVKRHPHANRDRVHVWMTEHFVRVGKSMGNPEMLGSFVCGFLAARADRRDLEHLERSLRIRLVTARTFQTTSYHFRPQQNPLT